MCKKITSIILTSIFIFISFADSTFALPAFPGAEGFGSDTVGGRGGTIIKVTNLNDSGTGSFRAAVTASGPRIVVFTVSGHIHTTSDIYITNPYITIAGQTSPGGICLSGGRVVIETHDVIITHMRFRMASDVCTANSNCDDYGDAMVIVAPMGAATPPFNIIMDHCSLSWGNDETLDIDAYYGPTAHDITVSNCLIAQGLDESSYPFSWEHNHALGVMVSSGHRNDSQKMTVSMHHNYMAHFRYRFPQIQGHATLDFRNNVIYNWYNAANTDFEYEPGTDSTVNFVHNYYKPGILSVGNICGSTASEGFFMDYSSECSNLTDCAADPYQMIYINGNLGCGRNSQTDPDGLNAQLRTGWSPGAWTRSAWFSPVPFDMPEVTTTTMSYSYAEEVAASAGANRCQSGENCSDSTDLEFIDDFKNGTGTTKIDMKYANYPTGWPIYSTPTSPTDSDNDGMSDAWERLSFNNSLTQTSAGDYDNDGYTNIEEYINELGGYVEGSGGDIMLPNAPNGLSVN